MLEHSLDKLKGIKGYLGSAIADYKGEILLSHTNDMNISKEDFAIIMGTINDIFRDAHTASASLDLGQNKEMTVETETASIITLCSGIDSKVHIHIFAIFDKDGNSALGRLTLKKILPKVVEEIAS